MLCDERFDNVLRTIETLARRNVRGHNSSLKNPFVRLINPNFWGKQDQGRVELVDIEVVREQVKNRSTIQQSSCVRNDPKAHPALFQGGEQGLRSRLTKSWGRSQECPQGRRR